MDIPQEKTQADQPLDLIDWPSRGAIAFKKVCLRYRPNTELVLKDLSFDISPGSKVGISGRTGSGKSTIINALTRIIEVESGTIEIDGVDISKLSLHQLRENITVIQQDPTLFQGSLRYNLDPTGARSDEELVALLKEAGLGSLLQRDQSASSKEGSANGLSFQIEENGNNLSSGEKQLLCICRAILRQTKIVLLDEATSNIDLVTEKQIEKLMKAAFKNCTVITIAHRLQTIINSDQHI